MDYVTNPANAIFRAKDFRGKSSPDLAPAEQEWVYLNRRSPFALHASFL
jgi:hypothetical protein